MRIVRLKNVQETLDTYCGQDIAAGDYYQLQDVDIKVFQTNAKVLNHISSTPQKLIVNNGTEDLDYIKGKNWLEGTYVQPVKTTTPFNEHSLQPIGMGKTLIDYTTSCYDITLSNGSSNVYTYSSSVTPKIGDCIGQDSWTNRAFITAVDTEAKTVTVETANSCSDLDNKLSLLSQPVELDYKLPETGIEDNLKWMLWGLRLRSSDTSEDDFGRCKIVDIDGAGVEAGYYNQATWNYLKATFGEKILVYYEETWMEYFKNSHLFTIPDNSPGPTHQGLYLRLVVYPTKKTGTAKLWWDWLITLKEEV